MNDQGKKENAKKYEQVNPVTEVCDILCIVYSVHLGGWMALIYVVDVILAM